MYPARGHDEPCNAYVCMHLMRDGVVFVFVVYFVPSPTSGGRGSEGSVVVGV